MVTIDDGKAFLKDLDEKRLLPSLSPIVAKLIELAANEESSLGQMAALIAKDPSLTTRVLKLANSAFFRSLYPAGTVLQAVARVGVHHTRLLALSVSVKDAFSLKQHGGPIDYGRFWRLSLYQGLLARWLAQHLKTGDPEEAFTAGFTLEIGLLALVRAHDTGIHLECPLPSLLALETERYGIQHRQIGEALLTAWGFPERIVACQRSFAFDDDTVPPSDLARICAFAGELSAFICGQTEHLHEVCAAAETAFGLGKWNVIEAVGTALEQVNEIAAALDVDIDGTKDTLDLMEKANQALARLASGPLDRPSAQSLPSLETLPEEDQTSEAVKVTLEAVAHEIRNPLTVVGGFVRRLAKTIDPTSREGTYVRVIMTETDRLEQVLHGMGRIVGTATDSIAPPAQEVSSGRLPLVRRVGRDC
jgi:HD-like signal output (HDOD) protein